MSNVELIKRKETQPEGSIRVVGEDIASGAFSESATIINVEDQRGSSKQGPQEQRNALLEHTEQPEEDPNNLVNKAYFSDEFEKEEIGEEERLEKALTDDIYSLMYISNMGGAAFWFAILVCLTQSAILGFIFYDLVNTTSDPPVTPNGTVNRFQIPSGNEFYVTCAQFFGVALTLSFMASGGDLLKGLDHLFNGFDYGVAKAKPGATRFKWAMAGILQALVGFVMTMDLFILMMQSTSVIGMCLNFAALHFVQDIDDVAFQVAANGLISRRIEAECNGVSDIMISATLKRRTTWMRRTVMTVMSLGLYTFFFVIVGYQMTGAFRCSAVNIQFGDFYFPELAYYSGRFESGGFSFAYTHSSRPVFIDASGTIRLRYSRAATAWLIQKNTNDDPPYMLKSSETKSFDVSNIGRSTWFANTDSGDLPVDFFSLICADCIESRCNPNYGTCEDNVCVCEEGRIGFNCEAEEPECEYLGLDLRTKNAVANIPGGSFFYDNQFQEMNSAAPFDMNFSFYGRNMYLPYEYGIAADRETIYNWIAFTGRRWVIFGSTVARTAELNVNDFVDFLLKTQFSNGTTIEGLNLLSKERGYRPVFFSSPVDFGTTSYGYDPTSVTWVFAKRVEQNSLAPENIFGLGPNDDDPVPAQFLCSDCNQSATCGNDGQCNNEWGYCMCLPFYSGFQCEYVHSCLELGCFNGGTCNELTGGCENCIPEAVGTLCQYPLPPKIKENKYFCNVTNGIAGPCENRQKCNGIDMKCECEEPFYGEFCEQSTQANCSDIWIATNDDNDDDVSDHDDDLVSNPQKIVPLAPYMDLDDDYVDPCQHGGYCDWRLQWPICRCKDPYRGDFCEIGPPSEEPNQTAVR